MMNMIDDFDMMTIEDVNAQSAREDIDYDDYMEAFEEEGFEIEPEPIELLVLDDGDLPF